MNKKGTDGSGFYQIGSVLSKDTSTIDKGLADLKAFCPHINKLINGFCKAQYITKADITDGIAKSLAVFDPSALKDVISVRYEQEGASIQYSVARQQFMKGLHDVLDDIDAECRKSFGEYEREKLSKGYCLELHERLQYLKVEDGLVSYDGDMLAETYTETVTTQEQADYLNKAREVYINICELNAETHRRAKDIDGVTDDVYGNPIIQVIDGKVYFQPENSRFLNF